MIWKIAEFCGVNVVTYAVMPNHFHVLVHIPKRIAISDHELLRRYRLLHPRPSPYQAARIEVVADWLKRNTPQGQAWREQQLALMHDLSSFMHLLKLRFSIWYNKKHDSFGTLWAERFKSVLVEHAGETLRTMAAYIDLNAVRKGLVTDPKDYRFCGYAEALAGSRRARRGLHVVCPHPTWQQTHSEYRTLLYAVGATPREDACSLSDQDFRNTMLSNGELPLATLLRHRWRYLTDATVLGQAAFVAKHTQPKKPPVHTPWGKWHMLHRLRNRRLPKASE